MYTKVLTNPYSSRCQGTAITKNSILVHSNVTEVTKFFHLIACKSMENTSTIDDPTLTIKPNDIATLLVYRSSQEGGDPTTQDGFQFLQ